LDKAKPWNKKGLYGAYRFIERSWKLLLSPEEKQTSDPPKKETTQLLHQTIKKVTDDIENLRFNTAISQMMIFQNHLSSLDKVNEKILRILLRLLSPFLPHMCEEVNSLWAGKDSIAYAAWPEYNKELAKVDEVEIAVQINGKLRSTINVTMDSDEEDVINQIKQIEKVIEYLNKGNLIKTIYIPNRLVNFVIKPI
jgi:leucyl-tRNA synthetase